MRFVAPALGALLLFPAVAAADVRIQAVDGPADNINGNVWAPNQATIKAGESVTWSFGGTTLIHNVKSDSSNWNLTTPFLTAGPDVTQRFDTPGTYTFLCELHRSSMTGTITVLGAAGEPAPPPPPPPLSEQPFANDIPPLSVFEKRDKVAPKLDRVRVTRVRAGVRVKFRLSEAGKVTVKATRGRSVKRRTVEVAKGTRSVTLKGLKAGRYRVQVSAKDLAGNAAKSTRRARVTVSR